MATQWVNGPHNLFTMFTTVDNKDELLQQKKAPPTTEVQVPVVKAPATQVQQPVDQYKQIRDAARDAQKSENKIPDEPRIIVGFKM